MSDDDQERTLGKLLAKVDNIEQTLSKADQGRAAVHRRVDEVVVDLGSVKQDIAGLKGDVAAISQTVADTKDVTDEVRRWKQMGIGALAVVGIGGTVLGATLASSLDWLLKLGRHG